MSKKKILLVGGSTAGHILPLLDIASEFDSSKFEFLYLGVNSAIEDRLLGKVSILRKKIICGKFRRDYSALSVLRNFLDLFSTVVGIIQSINILIFFRPDIIFSKSSYVAVPVTLAAKILSVPIVVHESDITPGLATRFCAKYAHAIFTAFPANMFTLSIRRKAIYTGLPIRKGFGHGDTSKGEFILITGGSQGAIEINNRMMAIIPDLLKKHNIVHLTGELDYERVMAQKDSLPSELKAKYIVKAFEENMPDLMKKAKLIISRSGATTIFEIASLNKSALFFPITSGVASHQVDNALFLKELQMAEVVLPIDSSREILTKINNLLRQGEKNEINNIYFKNSASYIAKLLSGYIEYYSLKKLKNVFMIGSGGISMRGIANILTKMGITVKGSDLKTGGHDPKNINLSYDLVVYSSAADKNSPARDEHLKAEKLKIKKIKRSEMIGLLMKGYRGISISGMHGKTSVSMLIARLLESSLLDPSYLIGSPSSQNNQSSRLGSGIDFVSEACEYDGSFLDFSTKIAVITNIEEEHLDYFKGGLPRIINEFSKFVSGIQPGGALIYCNDDKNVRKVINNTKDYLIDNRIALISYGFSKDSDVVLSSYKVENGLASFSINGVEFKTQKIGEFFALNSAAMYATGRHLGIEERDAVDTVLNFKGAARRSEFVGEKNGVKVYDDYAHHPTEIRVTLQALHEKFPQKRKFVIFEPHQQKRFNDFFSDFSKVLSESKIDVIAVLPVYRVPGRDEPVVKSVSDLVKRVNSSRIIELKDYREAADFIEENLKNGDILLTMGATDIYKVGRDYLKS